MKRTAIENRDMLQSAKSAIDNVSRVLAKMSKDNEDICAHLSRAWVLVDVAMMLMAEREKGLPGGLKVKSKPAPKKARKSPRSRPRSRG